MNKSKFFITAGILITVIIGLSAYIVLPKKEIETTHYFRNTIISMYTYKGSDIGKETKRLLRQYDDFSLWIDNYDTSDCNNKISVVNARHGQFPMLFALVHPDIEVHSFTFDVDEAALCTSCIPMPINLHIHYCNDATDVIRDMKESRIIDMKEIFKHKRILS